MVWLCWDATPKKADRLMWKGQSLSGNMGIRDPPHVRSSFLVGIEVFSEV